MNICVYSSSSDMVSPAFFTLAEELGSAIARRGHTLIYGGTNVGLMGACARATQRQGGRVVGVIPNFIAVRGLAYEQADELVLTGDMRQRKATMEARSDAFLALPGGFGTLEEMFEIITLKQLQRHSKPVVFLNRGGYYDPLAAVFEHMMRERFAKPVYRQMYEFVPEVAAALDYIETYRPVELPGKWYVTGAE
jgi:uncharacterized protein (TIGR00730 family)